MNVEIPSIQQMDFITKLSFFQNPEHLMVAIQDLATGAVSENTIAYLQLINYWVTSKWAQINESDVVRQLHVLLFQTIIPFFSNYPPEVQNHVSASQASFFINLHQSMVDLFAWIFNQNSDLLILFIKHLSKRLNSYIPTQIDQLRNLIEIINQTGIAGQIGQYALSIYSSNPEGCFTITDSIAPWANPKWIMEDSNYAIINNWLESPPTFNHALFLYQYAVAHTAPESRCEIFMKLIPLERLNEVMHGINNESCVQQSCEFLYYVYKLLTPEEGAQIIQFASSLIAEFTCTAHIILKIFQITPTPVFPPLEMIGFCWNAICQYTTIIDVQHLPSFMAVEELSGTLIVAAINEDKESCMGLIMQMFVDIDATEDPQRFLAQTSLYRLLRNCGVRVPEEKEIVNGFMAICEIEPEIIASNASATCALLNLFKLAITNGLAFAQHRNKLVMTFLKFVIASGADAETMAKFEQLLPSFLSNYGAHFEWSEDVLEALVTTESIKRAEAAGIAINAMQDPEMKDSCASGAIEILQSNIDISNPVPGVTALLEFCVATGGIDAEDIVAISLPLTADDSIHALVIKAQRRDPEFPNLLASHVGSISGPLSLATVMASIPPIKQKWQGDGFKEYMQGFFEGVMPMATAVMEFFMVGYYGPEEAEELIRSMDNAIGSTMSYLSEELVNAIIDWIIPLMMSAIDYPGLFAVMRRTLENLVMHSKQYLNALVNVSFLSILGSSFDPSVPAMRGLVSDAIVGLRKMRRYAQDLPTFINDAVMSIGFTQEEAARLNEIVNMRPSKALDDKLTQLLQLVWKHSFRNY